MGKSHGKKSFFFGFWREIRIIKRAKPLFVSVCLYPLIVIIGMLYLFNSEVITKVPVAVVDLDKTQTSRDLIRKVSATPAISVEKRYANLHDAKEAILEGKVFGIMLIPSEFEKKMLGNLQPEITTFSNLQFMSMGSALSVGFTQSLANGLMTIQAERLSTQGVTVQLAMQELTPISTDLHPVFNPTLNYLYTLVSGIVPTMLQIIVMLSIAYSVVRDKYSALGIRGLLQLNDYSLFRFLFSKIAPYALVFILSLFLLDIGLIALYDLPFHGLLLLQVLSSFIFIISASLCAIVLVLWLPQRSLNYGAVSIFASPAFGFTGLFYPRISMDLFAQIWGSILPITWYIGSRLDQTLRDVGLLTAMKSIIAMMMIGTVAYALIALRIFLMKKEVHHV